MGGDMSDTVKIGLSVLILCFLIGIVFQIFTMARSLTSKSTNQLQSVTNQMVDMSFATYDNQTVFGSTVRSAVSQYSGDKMCIIIDNNINGSIPGSINVLKPTSNAAGVATTPYYYGYALDGNKATYDATKSPYMNATLDTVVDNKSLDTSFINSSGDQYMYVNDAKRYQSILVKDNTGEICGIYFQLQQ